MGDKYCVDCAKYSCPPGIEIWHGQLCTHRRNTRAISYVTGKNWFPKGVWPLCKDINKDGNCISFLDNGKNSK